MDFQKEKVFTAVNADEVKVGSKGYFGDSIQELKEKIRGSGYVPGILSEIYDEEESCRFQMRDSAAFALFYLVEEPKEKKFRPYKDTSEMIRDFCERFNTGYADYELPRIWLGEKLATEHSYTDSKYLVVSFGFLKILVYGASNQLTMDELFEKFEYLDGSPCGKLE